MGGGRPTNRRSKDVLFALSVAGDMDRPLGRLALQKTIYLFDVLAVVWRAVGADARFRPWRNGPYDLTIQNAVDALVFRGFVDAMGLSFRKIRNTECVYSLTEAGAGAVAALTSHPAFADDLELFRVIATEVNRRGWDHIKELVYAEPTYGSSKSLLDQTPLELNDPGQNLAAQIIADICRPYEVTSQQPTSRLTMVQIFFAVLDEYRSSPDTVIAGGTK